MPFGMCNFSFQIIIYTPRSSINQFIVLVVTVVLFNVIRTGLNRI